MIAFISVFRSLSRRRMLALGAGLLLAGCSGGSEAPTTQLQLLNAGAAAVAAKRAAANAPPAPDLTRAMLDKTEGSLLEVSRERTGQKAYLFASLERRDDAPGKIIVWRTSDDVTLSTRNGVLIATRGLGGDVLSSAVLVNEAQGGPAGSGARVQYIRALDNKQQRLSLACDQSDLGAATIEIIGQRHATRRIQERCRGGGGVVVNDYWVGARTSIVWQSRQWAGPYIGYLRLRRLTR